MEPAPTCAECGRPRWMAAPCAWCNPLVALRARSIVRALEMATMPFGEWLIEWSGGTMGDIPRQTRLVWMEASDRAEREAVELTRSLVRQLLDVRNPLRYYPAAVTGGRR